MKRARTALAVTSQDRAELERLVRFGKTEQRIAFRGRIILQAADGISTSQIAKNLGTSRPTVTDWRMRYAAQGLSSLWGDRPRGRSFVGLSKDREAEVIEKTLHATPEGATHWSCRSMAKVVGMS